MEEGLTIVTNAQISTPFVMDHLPPDKEIPRASIPTVSRLRGDAAVARYEKAEGKRWARRRENSKFSGNRHIVKPSNKDFELNLAHPRTTFPKPLPPYLPRHISAPSASVPRRDPLSANAGRYSLSLKGVRKELRRAGPGAEYIVLDIERELTDWLVMGGVLVYPDQLDNPSFGNFAGKPLGSSNCITEVRRTPTELIWNIKEDFPRFLLHCVARFHGVVSFSKTTQCTAGELRLTHLLRPNVTRPDFIAPRTLETPPTSDIDTLSAVLDTEESDLEVVGDLPPVSEGEDFDTTITEVKSLEELEPVQRVNVFERTAVHRSQLPSQDREYEASVDDNDSSLGFDENDSLAFSIEPLNLDACNKRDWENNSRRRGSRSSASRSPTRPLRRRTPHTRPFVPAEARLTFWQYIYS